MVVNYKAKLAQVSIKHKVSDVFMVHWSVTDTHRECSHCTRDTELVNYAIEKYIHG